MKKLINYIYESSLSYDAEIPANINNILNALTKDLDFGKLKDTNDQDPNRFDISKINEQLFIDSFTKNNNEYKAISTQQYYELTSENKKWENLSDKEKSTFDTKNGDIIIVDEDNKPICFIDIKISKDYIGAISLGSLANFNENGYYICVCKNKKKVKFVSHKAVVKAVKENEDLLNPVMRGKYEGYPVKWEGKDLTSEYFVKGQTIDQIFK